MSRYQRGDALRKLSEADRAYRAAFRKLTSRGGRTGSDRTSFEELVVATERLHAAARGVLRDRNDSTSHDGSRAGDARLEEDQAR
jgi:hypothetical protein